MKRILILTAGILLQTSFASANQSLDALYGNYQEPNTLEAALNACRTNFSTVAEFVQCEDNAKRKYAKPDAPTQDTGAVCNLIGSPNDSSYCRKPDKPKKPRQPANFDNSVLGNSGTSNSGNSGVTQ